MKRRELIRLLEQYGCRFVREGSRHTWYEDAKGSLHAAIPRHRELDDFVVRKNL